VSRSQCSLRTRVASTSGYATPSLDLLFRLPVQKGSLNIGTAAEAMVRSLCIILLASCYQSLTVSQTLHGILCIDRYEELSGD